jgi:hypothetical protein
MAEFVFDNVESTSRPRLIRPFGGTNFELMESKGACASNCRAVYNLYIGSIMNREVVFPPISPVYHDICIHSIGEDAEDDSETEYVRTAAETELSLQPGTVPLING